MECVTLWFDPRIHKELLELSETAEYLESTTQTVYSLYHCKEIVWGSYGHLLLIVPNVKHFHSKIF